MPTVTMAWLRKTPTISGTMTNTPAIAAKNAMPARPARTDPLAEPPVRFRTVTAATPMASSPITSARISSPPEAGSPTRPWTARKPDNPSEASPRPKARFSWVLGGSAPPSPPPIRRSPARRWKMAARWVARYDTTAPTANIAMAPVVVSPPRRYSHAVSRPRVSSMTRSSRSMTPTISNVASPATNGLRFAGFRRRRDAPATARSTATPTWSRAPPAGSCPNVRMSPRTIGDSDTKMSRMFTALNSRMNAPTPTPVTAPATRPAISRSRAVTGTTWPSTLGSRDARYPVNSMAARKKIGPRVITPVITFVPLNRSTRPTAAREITITPPSRPPRSPLRAALPARAARRRAIAAAVSVTVAMSGSLLLLGAQDPAGPEEQDQDQDPERHHGLELVRRGDAGAGEDQARTHALQDAQEDPADPRSQDVADPPEHRGRERLDARDESHEVVDLVEHEHEQDPGRAGQEAPDGERGHDHAVDVDPHEGRDLLVLAHGPHGPSRLGALDEDGHLPHQDVDVRVGRRAGAEESPEAVLQKQRRPDGRDQQDQSRRAAQGPVRHALQYDGHHHRDQHRGREQDADRQEGAAVQHPRLVQCPSHEQRAEGPGHEYLAVGEVDQEQDPVDQGVSDGDDRVDAPPGDPPDGQPGPVCSAEPALLEGGGRPEDDPHQQDRAEPDQDDGAPRDPLEEQPALGGLNRRRRFAHQPLVEALRVDPRSTRSTSVLPLLSETPSPASLPAP